MSQSRPPAYTRLQIGLHWIVVALVIAQYGTSGAIVRMHSIHLIGQRQRPADLLLHTLHNRLGLALVAVMVARLAYRLWVGGPDTASSLSGRTARLVHAAFYAVLITEGVTGAVASYLWWSISLAHVILFKLLLALVAIHVAAVMWHQFVLRDAALHRIGLGRFFR